MSRPNLAIKKLARNKISSPKYSDADSHRGREHLLIRLESLDTYPRNFNFCQNETLCVNNEGNCSAWELLKRIIFNSRSIQGPPAMLVLEISKGRTSLSGISCRKANFLVSSPRVFFKNIFPTLWHRKVRINQVLVVKWEDLTFGVGVKGDIKLIQNCRKLKTPFRNPFLSSQPFVVDETSLKQKNDHKKRRWDS